MGCCSGREFAPTKDEDKLMTPKARLSECMVQLSRYQESLHRVNLYLKHYHKMSTDLYTLLYELKSAKRDYLRRVEALGDTVCRMNELLTALDTEVHEQYMSDKESTDLSKEELFTIIQVHKAQLQANKLEKLSDALKNCIASKDKREEFTLRLSKGLEAVKAASGAIIGHIKVTQDSKKGIKLLKSSLPEVKEVPVMNDRWREAVQRWDLLYKASLKLSEESESFAQWLLYHFQGIEIDLRTLQREIEDFYDGERLNKASEVHTAALQYLRLVGDRTGNASADCILSSMTPASPISVPDCHGLLSELLSWPEPPLSPEATYQKLLNLLHAKADDDVLRLTEKHRPLPFELFLISEIEKESSDLQEAKDRLRAFVGNINAVKDTRMGRVAQTLMKLGDIEGVSIHQEMAICRASRELQDIIDAESAVISIQEKWETGESAPLYKIIPLIERWFAAESEIGERIVISLIPTLTEAELVTYYVGYKLMESKRSPQELFQDLDLKEENRAQKEMFVDGIRTKLSIMLPASHLEALCPSSISREEFLNLFSPACFDPSNSRFSVSRVNVLAALHDKYEEWKLEVKCVFYLEYLLIPSEEEKICDQGAHTYIHNIAPELTEKQIQTYVRLLGVSSEFSLSFDELFSVLLAYPIGVSAKSFYCKRYSGISGLLWTKEGDCVPELAKQLVRESDEKARLNRTS